MWVRVRIDRMAGCSIYCSIGLVAGQRNTQVDDHHNDCGVCLNGGGYGDNKPTEQLDSLALRAQAPPVPHTRSAAEMRSKAPMRK
jgi:hypothetical protein